MGDTAPTPLPWLVAEILGTSRLHDNFVGALLDCLRVTDANGETLSTEQQKSGGIPAFLGILTAEADPVPGLGGFTLLGVNPDGEAHVLHSFFSVLVGLYNLDRRLFGCR